MKIDDISRIKNLKGFNSERIYLIEKLGFDAGFFLYRNCLCFAKAAAEETLTPVMTTYLEFNPSTKIRSVINDPSFAPGSYDFLTLKECEDYDILTSFIKLCELYGKNPSMAFSDFINAIVELCQLPRNQSKLDCLGFVGELFFLKKALEDGVDLSPLWHLSGSRSKYDFASDKVNYEVKTSDSESTAFLIKHEQVFNGQPNVIVLVSVRSDEAMGLSLKDLVRFARETEPFSQNLRFQIELEKELRKSIDPDMQNKKFLVSGIFGFDARKLGTIKNIPFCISEISYRYDFDVSEGLSVSEILEKLTDGKTKVLNPSRPKIW